MALVGLCHGKPHAAASTSDYHIGIEHAVGVESHGAIWSEQGFEVT